MLVHLNLKLDMMSKHVDSGWVCLVAHYKKEGDSHVLQPPCIKCERCGRFIRPENMGEECEQIT